MKRFVVIQTLHNGPAVLDRETGLRERISQQLVGFLDYQKVDPEPVDPPLPPDPIPLNESITRGAEVMRTHYSFARRGWVNPKSKPGKQRRRNY